MKLPESNEEIESNAFLNCTNLKNINIPLNIKFLGDSVFSNCHSLVDIEIPNIQKLSAYLFSNTSITVIRIKSKVIEIGNYAFLNCCKATEIIFAESSNHIKISEHAFEKCSSLKSLNIPKSVFSIEKYAFKDCLRIQTLIINAEFDCIECGTFSGCSSLVDVVIPPTVKEIKSSAFDNCASLSSIKLPKELKMIGQFAFSECYSLKMIIIPESVEEIGEYSFKKCSALKILQFENESKNKKIKIDDSCFFGCSSLKLNKKNFS